MCVCLCVFVVIMTRCDNMRSVTESNEQDVGGGGGWRWEKGGRGKEKEKAIYKFGARFPASSSQHSLAHARASYLPPSLL